MNTEKQITLFGLTVKVIVVHTVTYFIMGLLALTFLNYRTVFAEEITRVYMRGVDEPIMALGPALQFIRGTLFAMAFYPLCEVLFERKNGWLITWLLLVVLGILSRFHTGICDGRARYSDGKHDKERSLKCLQNIVSIALTCA